MTKTIVLSINIFPDLWEMIHYPIIKVVEFDIFKTHDSLPLIALIDSKSI